MSSPRERIAAAVALVAAADADPAILTDEIRHVLWTSAGLPDPGAGAPAALPARRRRWRRRDPVADLARKELGRVLAGLVDETAERIAALAMLCAELNRRDPGALRDVALHVASLEDEP
jgi:hypothetical protein